MLDDEEMTDIFKVVTNENLGKSDYKKPKDPAWKRNRSRLWLDCVVQSLRRADGQISGCGKLHTVAFLHLKSCLNGFGYAR